MNYGEVEEARAYAKILYVTHKVPDTPLSHIDFLADRSGYKELKLPDGRVVKVGQVHEGPRSIKRINCAAGSRTL